MSLRIFIWGVISAGAVCVGVAFLAGSWSPDWWAIIVVLGGMAVAQRLRIPTHHGLERQTMIGLFLAMGAILLPPTWLVIVIMASFIPVALHFWKGPTRLLFDLANIVLMGVAGWGAYHALDAALPVRQGPRLLIASTALCICGPVVNLAILAATSRLTTGVAARDQRGQRQTELLRAIGIASLGVTIAALWFTEPWAAPFGFVVALVVYQALLLPRLSEERDAIEQEARRDDLTGLLNRLGFREHLEREIAVARRTRLPLSLIVVDGTRLKAVNDEYGHAAGDSVIKSIGTALSERLRTSDVGARLGGDEFVALLPATDIDGAKRLIDDLRHSCGTVALPGREHGLYASFSAGAAMLEGEETADELFRRADREMYDDKIGTRNAIAI
jgi:diguanylate cyclase (GGDEF)-like protein